ncbi:MAG TPA: hypothetical protein VLB76_10240 [Thermoanaerobaculia bacterium]|jgi:hypothetical protein|nr:hypothetical protein [Thermoanaerobaculia bacterium]
MSTQQNGDRNDSDILGPIVAFGALAIIGLAYAVYRIVKELVKGVIVLAVLYLAIWILALLILPLLDLAAAMLISWRKRRRKRESVKHSTFPSHSHLQDPRYLDSLFWQMIDLHIGHRIATIQERGRDKYKTVDERVKATEDQRILRDILLRDPHGFREWKRDNLYEVIVSERNRSLLKEAYGRLWRFCVEEQRESKRSRRSVSPFTALVFSKIATEPKRDPWRITKVGIYLLSFGRSAAQKQETKALAPSLPEEQRLLEVFMDEERFRRFMDSHLFEFMDQVGALSLEIGDIQAPPSAPYVVVQNRPLLVSSTAPKPNATAITAHSESTRQKEEDDRKKRAAERQKEAQYQDKIRELEEHKQYRLKAEKLATELRDEKQEQERLRFRGQYLEKLTPGMLFQQFKNGTSPFSEDIRDMVFEETERAARAAELEALRQEPTRFAAFWKSHELAILRLHHDRIQVAAMNLRKQISGETQRQKELEVAEKRKQSIEEIISKASRAEEDREKQVKSGKLALGDEKYGYLLAVAWRRVRQEIAGSDHDQAANLLQRAIRDLLEASLSEHFSDKARRAVRHCNLFRQRLLPYSSQIEYGGLHPDDPLDDLILVFYVHGDSWFVQYLSEGQSSEAIRNEVMKAKGKMPWPAFREVLLRQDETRLTNLFNIFDKEMESVKMKQETI